MKLLHHFSLKKLNTFGLDAAASQYVVAKKAEDLRQICRLSTQPKRVLGGGSNVLLIGDLPGLTIKNEIGGIKIFEETEDVATVEAGGGVVWHDLVGWCIGQGLGGIENLSLIPGTVGAAPIQNIGAYGVELKDVFDSLSAMDLSTGEMQRFSHSDCQFGYRDSVFKREMKGRFCITSVRFNLSKKPILNTSYGDIQRTLGEMGIAQPTIRDVSNAVIKIRQSKLPDPAEIGNAGSFFKNPEIEAVDYQRFGAKFPVAPHFAMADSRVKIPAGWLIEQAGWKGQRFGDAGCHVRQALVLVNYGKATGEEILALAIKIQASVLEKFGIALAPEVNVW